MLRRGWPASLEAPNTVIMITIRVLVDLALIETPKIGSAIKCSCANQRFSGPVILLRWHAGPQGKLHLQLLRQSSAVPASLARASVLLFYPACGPQVALHLLSSSLSTPASVAVRVLPAP